MKQQIRNWGADKEGKELILCTLDNEKGITVQITNYGGIITSVKTPDRKGGIGEIVLGFDEASSYLDEKYIANCPYFGCITGRYAGRIAGGRFSIDGESFQLPVNNGGNTLHGGVEGFDKKTWDYRSISGSGFTGIELAYRSSHLEEGFPGNLDVKVTYILNESGELSIKYLAATDRPTVLNLTNHTYFNLTGGPGNALCHHLKIFSKRLIESRELIPTGHIVDVAGTAFDFSEPKPIRRDMGGLADGFDCGYLLPGIKGTLSPAATLWESESGRKVEIFTDQPDVHIYTGYYIPELAGRNGWSYGRYAGVAIETQHLPNSPNQPEFPSTRLNPGEEFESTTVFRFGTEPAE